MGSGQLSMYIHMYICTFCFPNSDHMTILRRLGPLFCSSKRVHADIFMLAKLKGEGGGPPPMEQP